ncbi:MAG: hypothetical protein ABSB13_08260 [Candidatus Binatus sp.]|jgi:hypothetical protein|uniref:hypothetical protein n=1 Tax=Candidatus Binatus sp. TaxID=2811406 RepID=UPI003D0C8236
MRHATLILGGLALFWTVQYNPPTYINPQPGGGYIITQPGAPTYQPPVYVNPQPGGGYIATQPGARIYQPPTYYNPQPGGGYIVTQPGAGNSGAYGGR